MKYSEREMGIILDTDFFKIKKEVTEKVQWQFGNLKTQLKAYIASSELLIPSEIDQSLGKISRGENYKGLPYLILDFPRDFSQKGVLAYRTMFWWGQGIYFTFHFSGHYYLRYRSTLLNAFDKLKVTNAYLYIHAENEWEHEVIPRNYLPFDQLNKKDYEKYLNANSYVKIAHQLRIDEIENLEEVGFKSFQQVAPLIFDRN